MSKTHEKLKHNQTIISQHLIFKVTQIFGHSKVV